MDQNNRPKRGLGALLAATTPLPDAAAPSEIGQTTPSAPATVTTAEVSVQSVRPNPDQPRTVFDPVALNELADSIKAQGLIQPLVVRPLKPEEIVGEARYELIAGERRWRASQIAGLTTIPIVIKSVFNERDILLLSLVENLQRDNLNPIEESVAYEKMASRFNLTHDQIANGLGKSRTYITNSIRLLDLPQSVLDALRNRKLTQGHAKVLLSLPDAKLQSHFAAKTQAENLTVRDLERLTIDTLKPESDGRSDKEKPAGLGAFSSSKTPREKPSRGTRLPSAEVQELERRLREHFGTRVSIEESLRKGRILIEFFSTDDLQRIVNLLKMDD
ncbi:MAG: ParB/RepB/Spo0J family partition protein [Planctomycetota bacterium]